MFSFSKQMFLLNDGAKVGVASVGSLEKGSEA